MTPNANNQSPFRFSTKYTDDESDFLYYGFRYYNPSTGRWLNRDSLEELGGINIYQFVYNDPIDVIDTDGREIAYANHSVAVGFYHSKIVVTPENQSKYANDPRFNNFDSQGRRFATIGAGPVDGKLTSGVNRENDVSKAPCHKRVLSLPSRYKNEDDAISELFKLTTEFNKHKPDYTLFPSPWTGEYNSNSFISGLIGAAGFDWFSDTGAKTPGWFPNWVPESHFGK